MNFRNRIIGSGMANPAELQANPRNWRQHPQSQADALAGVLDEVGWVQECIVNKRTGLLVDGHLRVDLALKRGETEVPVKYVDLSEAEEALVLATLDPLSAMAEAGAAQLDALLRDVSTGSAAVQEMLGDLAEQHGMTSSNGEPVLKQLDTKPPPKMTWVLLGIPTVRFGEIAADVERLAAIPDTICETTSNDG